MRYERAATLDRALELLHAEEWQVLAGGTDLYPATDAPALAGPVLDINALDELRGITVQADTWRVGARTTWSDVIAANLPASFDALKLAAREVGSVQIQNVATVAGNLCNASPAADGVPPLMILDAEVELQSISGARRLPLASFVRGNRRTDRRRDELMTAILCPRQSCEGGSSFIKIGARKYLVISIAMVAARLAVSHGVLADAAISVGSCSETARRLSDLERGLIGRPADETLRQAIGDDDVVPLLSPIDDVRATAEYRGRAAAELVRRAVTGCLDSLAAASVS